MHYDIYSSNFIKGIEQSCWGPLTYYVSNRDQVETGGGYKILTGGVGHGFAEVETTVHWGLNFSKVQAMQLCSDAVNFLQAVAKIVDTNFRV